MDRDVNQLKKKARRAEQQADWDRAIKLYREAIRVSEASDEYAPDVSIYNRVGDLYRRGGDTDRAVHYYLEAVDRYAEQDLQTGAIALCNKILRITPDRVEVYRRLGRLHAATGLVAEARNSYLEYASRMEDEGHPEARQEAFLELARITEDEDLYLQTVEELERDGRVDEAAAALEELREARRERGEATDEIRRRIAGLDPAADPVPAAAPASTSGPESPTTDGDAADDVNAVDSTAPARAEPAVPDEEPVASNPDVTADDAVEDGGEPAGTPGAPASDRTEVRLRYAEVLCRSGRESEAVEQLEKLLSAIDPVEAPERALRGLELLDDVGGLDDGWRDRAREWSEDVPEPDTAGALRRLAGEPDSGESAPASAGIETGLGPEADVDTEAEPEPKPEASPGEAVRTSDAEDPGPRERRSGEKGDRVEEGARLDELLVDFRARVEETVGQADPEEHLEMGQALHDMGRLDDAIREFQVAARAPEPPIRAFELLGAAFLEKGLVSVAVRVLTRALRTPGHKDHDLLQVLYLLGLAREELGETESALDCYERVYSVDIDFRDVADRMRAMAR